MAAMRMHGDVIQRAPQVLGCWRCMARLHQEKEAAIRWEE